MYPQAIVHELAKPKAKAKPRVTLSLAGVPDAAGIVTVTGRTYAKAKVSIDLGADGSIDRVLKADKKGNFKVQFYVDYGSLPVAVTGKAAGKKLATGSLVVNRPDSVAPTINLASVSPGSVGGTQAVIAGNVSDIGTGVRDLRVSVNDGPTQPVSFDGGGNFSFTTSLPLNGSADGQHTIRFTAYDRAGNASEIASASYLLDTTAPSLNVPALAPGGDLAVNPTIRGSVADSAAGLSSLQWKIDDGDYSSIAPDASGNFSFTTALLTDGSDNGSHTVTVQATDRLGNSSTQATSFTLNSPISAPTITSPVSGALANQDFVVTVTGNFPTVLTQIQVSIDSGSPIDILTFDPSATVNTSTGVFSFLTHFDTDGPHTVRVLGTTPSGDVLISNPVSITLDTVKPTLSITSPTAPLTTNQFPTVTGLAADTGSGIATNQNGKKYVTWELDHSGTINTVELNDDGSFAIAPAAGIADGEHTITIVAIDATGNLSTPVDVSFTLDTVKPTLTITSPNLPLTTKDYPTVTGVVADVGRGLATDENGKKYVTWELDHSGSTEKAEVGDDGTFTIAPPGGVADGAHVITIVATDLAGNSETADVDFIIDGLAPSLTIEQPNVTRDAVIRVSVIGHVASSLAGIPTVQVSLNGLPYAPVSVDAFGTFIQSVQFSNDPSMSGTYTSTFRATDSDGHEAIQTVTFTI